MDKEIWCDIKGYEGLYAVSNWGRVKSLGNDKSRKEKILKPAKDRKGYLLASLSKGKKRKRHLIHRLVLQTFAPVDNMSELLVNHINEIKDDNRLENLEWCTYSYNNTYNDRHRKVAEKLINGKRSIPIVQLTLEGKYIISWKSIKDAQREGGFNHGAINGCCRGKRNTHKGYKWQYLHEYIHNIDPRIKKVILFNKEYEF